MKLFRKFPFTISKVVLDIQYKKLSIRIDEQVAKQLKIKDLRKFKKYWKKVKVGWNKVQCLAFFQENNFCNSGLKLPRSRYQSFLLMSNFASFLHFVPEILFKINFYYLLQVLDSIQIQYFDLFYQKKVVFIEKSKV